MRNKTALIAQFIGQPNSFWGIEDSKNSEFAKFEGSVFKASGMSGVCCTGYAIEIVRQLGQHAEIHGFFATDAPESPIATLGYDGHDFALVDNRYIVDPWIGEVEDISEMMVFDLAIDEDRKQVEAIYGNEDNWKFNPALTFKWRRK